MNNKVFLYVTESGAQVEGIPTEGDVRARATRFNQSIDDLVTDMILKLDFYERQGYETSEDERSW